MQALRHKPKSRGKRADRSGEARISDFPNYQPDRIDQPAQVLCDREFRPSLGGSKTGPVSGVWAVQCFSCSGDDMRETVADRILAYLATNPGAYAKDIGAGIGVSRHHASNTLRVMERDGRVFFCPTKGTGSRYSARFYASGHDGRAKALANKAQAYRSPFGVLMAQLME